MIHFEEFYSNYLISKEQMGKSKWKCIKVKGNFSKLALKSIPMTIRKCFVLFHEVNV